MPQPFMFPPASPVPAVYPDHLGMIFYSSVHHSSHFYPDSWAAYAEVTLPLEKGLPSTWEGSVRFRGASGRWYGFRISASTKEDWLKEARFLLTRGALKH